MRNNSRIRILSFLLAVSVAFQSFPSIAATTPEEADFSAAAENPQEPVTLEEDVEILESTEQEEDGRIMESSEPEEILDEKNPVDESLSSNDTQQGIMTLGDTYLFETPEEITLLKKWLEAYHTSNEEIAWDDNTSTLTFMPIDSAEQLVLLSHTAPGVYQTAIFKSGKTQGQVSVSGAFNFSERTVNGETLDALGQLTFLGLGSDTVPFKGCFEQNNFAITADRVLFNALDYSTATFGGDALTINRVGTNHTDVMVATRFITDDEKSLKVTLQTDQEKFFVAPFGTIEFNANTDRLNLEVSFAGNKAFENFYSSNNAGMVANTVTGGTLSVKISNFPNSISVAIDNANEEKNNAGLMVGRLDNANLELNGEIALPATAKVQSAQGAAGGLVGRIDNETSCSAITVLNNVDLTKATILGKYSGGVAGYAKNVRFAFGESVPTVTLPEKLGETVNSLLDASKFVHSTYTGGIFGWYEQNHAGAYAIYDGQRIVYPDSINLHANTSAGEVGALFGHLQLGTGCNFTVSGADNKNRLSITCTVNVKDTTIRAAGCLVGGLEGNGRANQLTVINTNPVIKNVTTDKVGNLGGVVGSVKNATLSVVNITATVKTLDSVGYFGGVVGNIDQDGMLKTAETVKILTRNESDQYVDIAKGGGLVGQVGKRGVVYLRGTTDLSDVRYKQADNIGQLVGTQGDSLVFAYGDGKNENTWQYMRSTDNKRVDDIGNYGQVIRLGGNLDNALITISDDDNTIGFKVPSIDNIEITSADNFELTIASADDFALLAIAFMTNNSFGLYGNIPISTLNKIYTYKLTDNIDLSGTGIQGLMRDRESDTQIIEGFKNNNKHSIFDGNKKELRFNVGEPYGLRDGVVVDNTQSGSGQCYRHGCYGLIGNANSIIVQNLRLGGTMNIGDDLDSVAGFVIGRISGGNATASVENLIDSVTLLPGSTINVDGSSNTAVGGFIGSVAVGDATDLAVKNSTMSADISYTNTYDKISVGGILGKATYKNSFQCTMDSVKVSGKIKSNSAQNARVGGLIADIVPLDNTKRNDGVATVSLKNVKLAAGIEASAAKTSCGGLLGYYWDNVYVTFEGSEDYSVATVAGSFLKAEKLEKGSSNDSRGMGGLCFAATGKWEMRDKAVNLENTTINCGAGPLGLLVCHGERQGATVGKYMSADGKALYLEMNTEWGTAYKLGTGNDFITGTPAVFDEIVAFTAANDDIIQNDAGVISLHTANGTVYMTTSGSGNTYENRTAYGIAGNKVNPYSRYYYNLDVIQNEVTAGDVNTPQALLLWSVRKYCAANIRDKYLNVSLTDTITGTLNMDGYSYYPVTVCNESVTVTNATITFYNDEIETKENGNKSTRAAVNTDRTQHFAMHSGLLYDYYTDKDSSGTISLTVNGPTTLLGTIGKVGDGSGALICGKIYGYSGALPARLDLNGLNLDSGYSENDTTTYLSVAGVTLSDSDAYAPLLINNVGSFAVLNIAGVTAHDTTAGATSLIGNVGDEGDINTQGINISFERMQLPDKQGRFTKATMLNRLYYISANNSVVYNFTEDEEWNGESYTHTATYGKEIGGTVEYAESSSNPYQYRYAQSQSNVAYPDGLGGKVGGSAEAFAGYLPYVATGYELANGYHEILVNSSLTDILSGCGTYGDPYRLNSVEELMSVVSYLKNKTSASKGWTLNIPVAEAGNSKFCSGIDTGITHKTYQYDGESGKEWKLQDENSTLSNDDTLTNDTVYTYLQNAYYMITNNVNNKVLTNFAGFGTRENPFRGVIIGESEGVTLTLNGNLPQGFIQCSYGSVVKNLTLKVEGSSTISFVGIKDGSGYTVGSYYGGVIGCVLGGDNIIENVSVIYSQETTPVTLVEKDHLIPVGGYVGVISGGGVIFRGNNALKNVPCDKVNDANYFYANPYVGRVVQGFAVQEGATESTQLNNSITVTVDGQSQQVDKNYQICQLNVDNASDITVNDKEITLKNAQALLVFTSITNSGGAGSGGLLPYHTNARSYWDGSTFSAASVGGKVRNASYAHVGNAAADNADYILSLKDDFVAFGSENASYLDTHYAQGELYNVCHATNAYSIKLSGGIYDMTIYGNGYRSIGARYLSNAVCDSTANTTKVENRSNYKLLNPLVSGFDGGEATLKTAITSKEYVDDENHAIAVGGVFNTIRLTANATTLKDITIGNGTNTTSTIYHEYWENLSTGWNDSTHKNWNNDAATEVYAGFKNLTYNHGRGLIAAGGFAGNTSMENTNKSVTFEKINTKNLHIKSPFDAGGILGHTGFVVANTNTYKTESQNYSICCLINGGGNDIVPTFHNCTFDNLTVDGGWMVGGYLGIATQNSTAPLSGTSSKTGVIKISFDTNGLLGNNSSIVSRRKKTDKGIDTDKVAGSAGVQRCLPAAGGLIGCSSYTITIDNAGRAKMNSVQVLSSRSTGGVIGWPFNAVTIKNLDVIGNDDNKTQIGDLRLYKEGGNEPCCEFAGGMIGYFESGGTLTVTDCSVENLLVVASYRSPETSTSTYPCYAAGIVGDLNASGKHTIANCKVKNLFIANDNMTVPNVATSFEGGMVGRLGKGELYGANLLLDCIQFSVLNAKKDNDYIGIVVGSPNTSTSAAANNGRTIYLAGVSIQEPKKLWTSDASEKTHAEYSRKILDIGGPKALKSYIAYADYNGTDKVEDTQGKDVFIDTKLCADPYVTTSPKGVSIPVGEQETQMYLYGDGANPLTVNQIYNERERTDSAKFYYSNAKDCLFDSKYCSTFWDEMGLTKDTAGNIPNFRVLQVPVASEGTVTKQIKDYINLVTNNGYKTAMEIEFGDNKDHVSRELTLYKWNADGYFEKEMDYTKYALNYEGVTNRDTYTTSLTEYDSGKNQFELLTVTFTEQGYKYTVQIPIVVRRMLEIDFMATLKDSPNFQKENYEVPAGLTYNPKSPLDYGSSVSALLTYTYNSAMGAQQDFNWEFHLNNGGFMGDTGQTIRFVRTGGLNNLPEGTQLILLDCEDNNKAYSYPVGVGGATEVKLSDFKDAGNNNYSRWLSEIMGVEANEASEGAWVETDKSSATARIQGTYYRPYEESSDGTSVKRYTLTIPDANKTISEQFYLVIYIPLNETTAGQNLNGYIDTSFSILSEKLACHINPVRKQRDNNGTIRVVTDPRTDSDCTFNFLSSYKQELSDESADKSKDPNHLVLLDNPESDGNYLLKMSLLDKISVNKDQTFDDSVNLYFKEVVSLSSYKKEGGTPNFVSSSGFPNGCYGTVEYYVYTVSGGEKQYYTWGNNQWKEAAGEAMAVSYPWVSDSKNMELYLATENTAENAISLAGIRKVAQGTFYVETRLNIHMSVEAAQLVIAGTTSKGDAYTSLNYLTYLASGKGEEFNATNYVAPKQGEVKYYQSRSGSSAITHSSNDPTQLGINCSDLVSADGIIYTTGVYDLTLVSNAQELLGDGKIAGKAKRVQYTLTLWQRQENGDYSQVTDKLANYITSVRMNGESVALNGSSWQWSDRYTNGFDTMDKQNPKRFILPIRVQVNTDVEANGVTFANYQLRLTAALLDEHNEVLDTPKNPIPGTEDTRNYDYVTYTITRILTDGYWGEP